MKAWSPWSKSNDFPGGCSISSDSKPSLSRKPPTTQKPGWGEQNGAASMIETVEVQSIFSVCFGVLVSLKQPEPSPKFQKLVCPSSLGLRFSCGRNPLDRLGVGNTGKPTLPFLFCFGGGVPNSCFDTYPCFNTPSCLPLKFQFPSKTFPWVGLVALLENMSSDFWMCWHEQS